MGSAGWPKSQVQDFLVATDDERIETVCRENEIPCLMTSKEWLMERNGAEGIWTNIGRLLHQCSRRRASREHIGDKYDVLLSS